MRHLRPSLLIVAFAVMAMTACAARSPSIADLQYNPGRYYNRSVSVEGVVTSSWGVPLVPFKVYKIGDSSGEVTVVSNQSRVPPRGARGRTGLTRNDPSRTIYTHDHIALASLHPRHSAVLRCDPGAAWTRSGTADRSRSAARPPPITPTAASAVGRSAGMLGG